jgi:hypothetical protein
MLLFPRYQRYDKGTLPQPRQRIVWLTFGAEILMFTFATNRGSTRSFRVQHSRLFGRDQAIGPALVGQHASP